MSSTNTGCEPGFCPDTFITLGDACTTIAQIHKTAKPATIRKFLVGAAFYGNQSGLEGYAERFEESYVRLDRSDVGAYRATPETYSSIPRDFWRIQMALSEDAKRVFAVGNLSHITEMTVSELPYRLRDRGADSLQNERVCLSQFAWGVHFPREHLLALVEDPEWQAWGSVALALRIRGKQGHPKVWKWDEVKVALTIEAARNPEILKKGPGAIVQFMNDEFRHRHHEQIPERKEVDAYVKYFAALWAAPEEGAPTD